MEHLHPPQRWSLTAYLVAVRVLFVGCVGAVAMVGGLSTMAALVIVSSGLLAWNLVGIWARPAHPRPTGPSGPPGQAGGDRSPRSGPPSAPASMAAGSLLPDPGHSSSST